MEEPIKRKVGRPASGLGKKNEPSRIRDYPTLLVTVRPDTRARLKAIAEHEQRPAWKVVESAINLYFDQMSIRDRHAVRTIAKPSQAK